jgi:sporulation integral membrane protein YlbJ
MFFPATAYILIGVIVMKSRHQLWTGIIGAVGMLVLILDAKTALTGAKEGIELCLYTVIPSLFPFFILSILINRSLTGKTFRLLRPIGKLCGIPEGAETLFLLGLLGGYPVGAQSISEAYHAKTLNRNDARRMLGFCNNAGPAFIFGMVGSLFDRPLIPWLLWGIHIVSGFLVGCILPGKSRSSCRPTQGSPITIPQALEKSVKTMALVCGWVIVFRVVFAFLQRWFLWLFPIDVQIWFTGILELSNGCFALHAITSHGTRFVVSAGILAFGGICVAMQTMSVTGELGTGMYFPGKLLQCCISIILAVISLQFIFNATQQWEISRIGIIAIALTASGLSVYTYRKKKIVAIPC